MAEGEGTKSVEQNLLSVAPMIKEIHGDLAHCAKQYGNSIKALRDKLAGIWADKNAVKFGKDLNNLLLEIEKNVNTNFTVAKNNLLAVMKYLLTTGGFDQATFGTYYHEEYSLTISIPHNYEFAEFLNDDKINGKFGVNNVNTAAADAKAAITQSLTTLRNATSEFKSSIQKASSNVFTDVSLQQSSANLVNRIISIVDKSLEALSGFVESTVTQAVSGYTTAATNQAGQLDAVKEQGGAEETGA